MLLEAKSMTSYQLKATDGEIGKVNDFYFDDRFWAVRYTVAETGTWLHGKKVLLSPHAITAVSADEEAISFDLTQKQIEGSPAWDSQKPVSQQYEQMYYSYYGWPTYWSGSSMWGNYPSLMRMHVDLDEPNPDEEHWDPTLRSMNSVDGYHIHTSTGHIGHIVDFIINTSNWEIKYLVIDTRNWLPGKIVLISPQWVDSISWRDSRINVNATPEIIRESPAYTPGIVITEDYETELKFYYQNAWPKNVAELSGAIK